jgi:hypothetical protein
LSFARQDVTIYLNRSLALTLAARNPNAMEGAIAHNRNNTQGDYITIPYLVQTGLIDNVAGV